MEYRYVWDYRFIDFSKSAKDKNFKILNAMTEAIKYRGPDDSGNWCNLKSDVFLGHRRLAILDLSKSGLSQWLVKITDT